MRPQRQYFQEMQCIYEPKMFTINLTQENRNISFHGSKDIFPLLFYIKVLSQASPSFAPGVKLVYE